MKLNLLHTILLVKKKKNKKNHLFLYEPVDITYFFKTKQIK